MLIDSTTDSSTINCTFNNTTNSADSTTLNYHRSLDYDENSCFEFLKNGSSDLIG